MPRVSQHSSSMSQQQHGDPNAVLIRQMLRKEDDYRNGIKENQSLANALAQRLDHGGEMENLLGDLTEYRDRLKQLAEHNVGQDRHVSAFLQALQKVGDQPSTDVKDYQQALEATMDKELEIIHRASVEVHQEPMYLEICAKLGENQAPKDDELEVLNAGGGPSGNNLKCPLTGTLLQDPLKNKLCGHVYSKHAIVEHLMRDLRCPVFGCNNESVKEEQLEPDMETANLVRRERIRQEHRQREQSQNAIDMDDDDDEENEM
jgi:hypothetical protein